MKNKFSMIILFPLFFSLSACSNRSSRPATVNETVSSSATHKASKQANEFKPNLKKKYPGFKLTSIPEQFRGTWYRSDPLSKSVDHNSEQKNKTYSGGDSMIAIEQHQGQTWMRVREFLTPVDIIYITGQFKGHPCLYLAYSSGDIHNALFKNKALAIKYKNYDFSKIKS